MSLGECGSKTSLVAVIFSFLAFKNCLGLESESCSQSSLLGSNCQLLSGKISVCCVESGPCGSGRSSFSYQAGKRSCGSGVGSSNCSFLGVVVIDCSGVGGSGAILCSNSSSVRCISCGSLQLHSSKVGVSLCLCGIGGSFNLDLECLLGSSKVPSRGSSSLSGKFWI